MARLGQFRQIDWNFVFAYPLSQVLVHFLGLLPIPVDIREKQQSKTLAVWQLRWQAPRRRVQWVSRVYLWYTAIYFLPILQSHGTSFSVSPQTCLTLAIPSCHSRRKNGKKHSDGRSVTESCSWQSRRSLLETRSSHSRANQFQGYGITTKRLIRVWFSCRTRHVGDKCIIYSDTDSLSFCLVIAETLETAAWRRGKVQSNEIFLVITSLQKQLDQGIDKPMKVLIDVDTITRRETIPSFSGMGKLISVQHLQCSEIYFQDMARIGEERRVSEAIRRHLCVSCVSYTGRSARVWMSCAGRLTEPEEGKSSQWLCRHGSDLYGFALQEQLLAAMWRDVGTEKTVENTTL